MVFGPRRNTPSCSVTVRGVVLSSGYFIQVSWCCPFSNTFLDSSRSALGGARQPFVRTVRFPVPFRLSPFAHGIINLHGVRPPQCCWGGSVFFFPSPIARRSLDSALRRWGWPDTQRISSGRLLSLIVRSLLPSSAPPARVEHWPSTRWNCVLLSMLISPSPPPPPPPPASVSPPSCSRRWFESEMRQVLDGALRIRLFVAIASLSLVQFPPSAVSVGGGSDLMIYGRASSPAHARSWSLARWGHDPFSGGLAARHKQLLLECRFFHVPVGCLCALGSATCGRSVVSEGLCSCWVFF